MAFKFARTPLTLIAGLLWTFVAIMNFYTVIMILAPLNYFLASLPLIMSILAGILGFYYLTLPKRNYIVINEDCIMIHKGMIYKNTRIFFNDIEAIMEKENKIRIQERSGKETSVILSMLELKGIRELRRTFEEKCKSETMH